MLMWPDIVLQTSAGRSLAIERLKTSVDHALTIFERGRQDPDKGG